MSTPTTPAAGANATAAPKQPVNTEFEPELDSLPEDLPTAQATPEAPRQAGAVSAAATPAPAAPSTPAHDPQLVRIAKLLGLGDDDIAERNTEELHRTVNLLNKQRLASLERETTQPARPAATPERPAPPPEPTFETDMLPSLDGFPPEMIEAQRKLYDLSVKPLREANKKLAEYEHREQQRAATTVHDAIDQGFSAMGAEYAALVGTGSYDEATDDQKFARDAIVAAVNGQPKRLTKPREITAAISAAGKRLLGHRAAAAAATTTETPTLGNYGGAGDEEVPTRHHIHEQVRNPNGTVGTRTKTQLDEEIERYNSQTSTPPTARTQPGGGADDKPGPAKALRTAKKMLFTMNGAEE